MRKLPDLKNLNISGLLGKLAKNLSLLFFAIFLFIVLMEIFEVNKPLQIILSANKIPQSQVAHQGIRVDFTDFDKILQRIQQAQDFTPSASSSTLPNPFGTGH